MPKELTHWMLAERARDALPAGSLLAAVIARHPEPYLGGAVLPDTLAHVFRGPFHPAAQALSRRFHDAAGNSYQPLIRMEQSYPHALPAAELASLLGVISHMEADMALHPYVFAATGDDIGRHYRLETLIDVHFLPEMASPHRRLDRLLASGTRKVLARAAHHLFAGGEDLPMEAMEHALKLHCRFQAMYDKIVWKIAVKVLGKLLGSPYREQKELFYPFRMGGFRPHRAGSRKSPPTGSSGGISSSGRGAGGTDGRWRHPETGELKSSSVDDLAKEAVESTVELFRRIEEAGSLAAALGSLPGRNLLTGVHGVTKKE